MRYRFHLAAARPALALLLAAACSPGTPETAPGDAPAASLPPPAAPSAPAPGGTMPDATPTDTARAGEVRITGRLTDEGVECPALRGDDGKLYTLAGDTKGFRPGDRVTVTGTVAEMSTCMQGTTIGVRTITAASGG